MNQATIDEIANKAALNSIKEYKQIESKKKDKKYRIKTKLLLKNYKAIKHVVEEGISEANQLEIDLSEELNEDELFVASIRRSKVRSLMMLTHIDSALSALEREQYNKKDENEELKYIIFTYVWLDNMTAENAAEVYGCSTVTAHRYCSNMINKLSVYLFGIDGISLD